MTLAADGGLKSIPTIADEHGDASVRAGLGTSLNVHKAERKPVRPSLAPLFQRQSQNISRICLVYVLTYCQSEMVPTGKEQQHHNNRDRSGPR